MWLGRGCIAIRMVPYAKETVTDVILETPTRRKPICGDILIYRS